MMPYFPSITEFNLQKFDSRSRRLLIVAEGFEERSLEWIRHISKKIWFERCLLCRYVPEKKARLNELLEEVKPRSRTEPQIIDFHRFNPAVFEQALDSELTPLLSTIDEIVIDISVMSKLMIMIFIWYLRCYQGRVRVIYTEPMDYAPTKKEYEEHKTQLEKPVTLPSYGVHEVVRTPQLSSVVMQRSPSLVIAFNSFNEQLIRALLSTINPSRLFLINGIPPHLDWREQATQDIHSAVIAEYAEDNLVDASTGRMLRRASTLFFEETFEILAGIYRQFCFSHRFILAPTGSKMQALGCGIMKACCPDIHLEYPTPESYIVKGYSSKEVRAIHELCIEEMAELISGASEKYQLNG